MWKSVPQVRQAHILRSQDFLTDWSHGQMPRCHAVRYFNSWPSTSRLCSANHLRCTGAWGCKLIKQGTSQRFSKETRTSRDTLDVAYVRNDFYVLTMLIDHWEPERRKTFQQVLAKHIPYSVIYSRSSSEVEIHLHIVSPRSIFWNLYDPGTYWRVRKMVEWSLRWYWSILVSMIRSNGCWKLTWKVKSVFQEEKNDIFLCKWSQLKVETAVRITVTTSWWCEAQWWHHVQILERRQLAKLQQGGIIVWHLVYVHIKFIYDYVGMGVYIPLWQTFGHRYFIGCA